MSKQKIEYELRDAKGKIITIVDDRDLAIRYCKWSCPDGIYNLIGGEDDVIFERRNGILYPTAGKLLDVQFPPRSLREATDIFGDPSPPTVDQE